MTSVFQLCKKCRKKSQDHTGNPELGSEAAQGGNGSKKSSFFKRKGAVRKKKGKDKSAAKSKDHVAVSPEKANNDTTEEPTTHYQTQQSSQLGEVCLVNETLRSEAVSDCKSRMSEQSSCSPNETPASTPKGDFSATSLESEPLGSWNRSQNGQNDRPASDSAFVHTSDDNEIVLHLSVPEAPFAPPPPPCKQNRPVYLRTL